MIGIYWLVGKRRTERSREWRRTKIWQKHMLKTSRWKTAMKWQKGLRQREDRDYEINMNINNISQNEMQSIAYVWNSIYSSVPRLTDFEVSSIPSRPFLTLMWINNTGSGVQSNARVGDFKLRVCKMLITVNINY